MLRIRLGRRWKRERPAAPRDAFALELDDVALVPQASDEPLDRVIPELLETVRRLCRGDPLGQVSLPESHLELLFAREEDDLRLHIVSLGRPARILRGPLTLPLAALRDAAVGAGAQWQEDLGGHGRPTRGQARAARLTESLLSSHLAPPTAPVADRIGGVWVAPRTRPGFDVVLADTRGWLAASGARGARAPLAGLLVDARLLLDSRWEWTGPLFPAVLEASRLGEELVRALDTGESLWSGELGDGQTQWRVDLQRGRVEGPAAGTPWTARTLAAALLEVGLSAAEAAVRGAPGQRTNPHLVELRARCHSGLLALRSLAPAEALAAERTTPPTRRRTRRNPLQPHARLRRLRFETRWRVPGAADEGPALLLHGPGGGILVVQSKCVRAYRRDGTLAAQHRSQRGLAVGAPGRLVTAGAERLLGGRPGRDAALWTRDHDGATMRGPLLEMDGVLLALADGRSVRALASETGLELWRFAPPRPGRLALAVHGGGILVTSESGTLHGLGPDGGVRFRVASPLPFLGPAVPWGRSVVALLGRGERSGLLAANARSGEVRWMVELAIGDCAAPLAQGAQVWVVGSDEGHAVLHAFGPNGASRWQRRLPLGPGPYRLLGLRGDALATGVNGAAVRVSSEGRLVWRLGAAGSAVGPSLPPALVREVLLVPGECVRAVDPAGGRVLAALESGSGPRAMAARGALDVFLLDEAGDLTRSALTTQLGLVGA